MDLSSVGAAAVATYVGILVAAIVEGEFAYIAASALVAQGQLNPVAVVVSGALGAAIGDQAFFYLCRGRLPRLMARYPAVALKTRPLLAPVRRHASLMVLSIRFAPGLRIAIAAACAAVEVPPVRFSALSLLSSFVWALVILSLVGWLGPGYLARYGLGGWKGALLVGLVVVAVLRALGSVERRVLHTPDASGRTP